MVSTTKADVLTKVWKVVEYADTSYSEIVSQTGNIIKVSYWLSEHYPVRSEALEALEVIRSMCGQISALQRMQRQKYDPLKDDGIYSIAVDMIPAAIRKVKWPPGSKPGLDNIEWSGRAIGVAVRQRQGAHRDTA